MEVLKKLSLVYCRKILESNGKKFSDQQVEKIRDLLYVLGELDYLIYNQMKRAHINLPEENKAA